MVTNRAGLTTAPITTQTLSSGFGTEAHALLCRRYVKGRDWYDFLWYVARRTVPDLALLGNALLQQGPWHGNRVEVSSDWLLQALRAKIERVDWKLARDDVQRFLPLSEQRGFSTRCDPSVTAAGRLRFRTTTRQRC